MKNLLTLLLFNILFFTNAYGKQIEEPFFYQIAKEVDVAAGKIYLYSESILLDKSGSILLFHDGYAIPLRSLHSDEKGVYIHMAGGKCWNGHPVWCEGCNGCGVLFCPAHCRCF